MAGQRQTNEAREAREQAAPENGGREAGDRAGGVASEVASEIRQTLRGELTNVVRAAAIEVLSPVARKATASAAKYAVTRGPEFVKDVVMPKLQDAGGPAAIAKAVGSKAGGAGQLLSKVGGRGRGGDGKGGAAASGTGRGRRLPVQEYIDVAVPVDTAYDQWTQFEDFPQFMRGVEQVEQRDDTTLVWHEKLWGVRRSWVAEITDQRPEERIAWRSTGGPQHIGVVTFHRLSDRLTRVQVNLDHEPKGLFEKTASGMRYTRRGLKSDLKRFKAFVEMRDEPTGAWRGRVEDSEVVEEEETGRPPEDREEPRDQDQEPDQEPEEKPRRRPRRQDGDGQQSRAQQDDDEGEYDEDAEAPSDEEYQEDGEDQEKPAPRRRRERVSRRA